MADSVMKLWFWPWEVVRVVGHLNETAVATQSVVSARLPMISEAAANPSNASHRELSLMVSEKMDAFGRSGRVIVKAGDAIRRASSANARDLGRVSKGGMLTPFDLMTMFERNLLLATTLMTLPMQALAPVHEGVTANARRLRDA